MKIVERRQSGYLMECDCLASSTPDIEQSRCARPASSGQHGIAWPALRVDFGIDIAAGADDGDRLPLSMEILPARTAASATAPPGSTTSLK